MNLSPLGSGALAGTTYPLIVHIAHNYWVLTGQLLIAWIAFQIEII